MSIRPFWLLLAMMAGLLFAAGCGGDNSSSADADGNEIIVETGLLSKAEFIERADAMCEKRKGEVLNGFSSIVKEGARKPEQIQTKEFVYTVLVPSYEKLIDEISTLGAPREDEKEVTAFLSALKKELDYANTHPVKALNRLTPFQGAGKAATAYGLAGCADSLT